MLRSLWPNQQGADMTDSDRPEIRDGEQVLDFDPGLQLDGTITFIGHIRSP